MALVVEFSGIQPSQAFDGDAGLDLYATSESHIPVGGMSKIGTGTKMAIPTGHVGLLFSRSSLGSSGISMSNGVGVIDSGYRGEIRVPLRNSSGKVHQISEGERIAQVVIVPQPAIKLVRAANLGVTERGDGGFGSSGK